MAGRQTGHLKNEILPVYWKRSLGPKVLFKYTHRFFDTSPIKREVFIPSCLKWAILVIGHRNDAVRLGHKGR